MRRKIRQATSCVICLEDVSLNESLLLGKCGHLFHSKCITKWLDNCVKLGKNRTCALCRANWETANESPGLSVSSSSSFAYRVPSPKSTLVSVKMKLDDEEEGNAIQNAWQWRHRRAVRIDDDEEDNAENGESSWNRYMDLSGAVYWHEPLTSRFRWDEDFQVDSSSLWVQCVDEETGRGYYYNTQTGESRWVMKREEKEME